MPHATPALDKINAVGLDQLCDWFANGRSQTDIARELGINQSHLSHWISADPTRSARVNMCRELGAEAYELQALDILETARQEIRDDPQISAAIVALARERAQTCWRMASVRDPRRYSDKRGDTYNIDARKAVQSVTIIGVPPRGEGGVHRIAATGGSQHVGVLPSSGAVLPSSGSETESAVFPARAEKSVSDMLVSTSKYRRKVVDE